MSHVVYSVLKGGREQGVAKTVALKELGQPWQREEAIS